MSTVQCSMWGEPHITATWPSPRAVVQRARFGIDVFNIAGLYRMASAADGSWEVQIFNCGVYACAMAARLGKDIIEVIVNRGGSLEYFVKSVSTAPTARLWLLTLIRTGARLINLEVALTTQMARSCLTLSRAGPLAVEEIDALTEDKTTTIGELGVHIVQTKVLDAEESLLEDKSFLAVLEKNCATKANGVCRDLQAAFRGAPRVRRRHQHAQR